MAINRTYSLRGYGALLMRVSLGVMYLLILASLVQAMIGEGSYALRIRAAGLRLAY
ncbi:MAG: hypothetical protein HY067_14055 [Betaproteobacteria bacterium]|nr:hypothetical protein [Betaproteobacteria bacterium]